MIKNVAKEVVQCQQWDIYCKIYAAFDNNYYKIIIKSNLIRSTVHKISDWLNVKKV